MEFNKTVSNPMLVGAIQLLKEEDSPEHRNMFVIELQKASYIAPALVDPEPVESADGKRTIAPGSKIQFPMLTSSVGKQFFMGFTDVAEYRKWVEKNKELPFFALRFEDLAAMLLQKDALGKQSPALGFVINPYGENIIVPKMIAAGIMAARLDKQKNAAGPAGQSGKQD